MVIRIKTPRQEFEAAKNHGYVYGYIQRKQAFPVYVELGKEEEYIRSARDDDRTDYKLFRRCNVFLSENDEQLDNEKYISQSSNETVIIYC